MMVPVDTNGLVASFLVRRPDSPVARIVRGMLEGRFSFLLSVDLLAEYRSVLLRPAIRKRHSLSEEDVDSFLEEVAFLGVVREPRTLCEPAPDSGGQSCVACVACVAVAQSPARICSRDRRTDASGISSGIRLAPLARYFLSAVWTLSQFLPVGRGHPSVPPRHDRSEFSRRGRRLRLLT